MAKTVGNTSDRIESASDFPDDPEGKQRRWEVELNAAKEWFSTFWDKGGKVVKRYLDEESGGANESHLNLFWSNVTTSRALLYGKVPRVDVDRRYADSDDDVARVGSEMLERIANSDLERDDDPYALAIQYALEDWTLPGLGQCRVRYEMEETELPGKEAITDAGGLEIAPEVPPQTVKAWEEAATDYVYWQDFMYSPCRVWSEVRWVSFKAEMTRDECVKRFGEKLGKKVPMRSKLPDNVNPEGGIEDAWLRAEIYEVWCKEDKTVRWLSFGMDEILDEKKDPLGLGGFFPCPRPLTKNTTTTAFIPKADFQLAEDLYNEIDELTTRIRLLESSVRVSAAYDAACVEIAQMVSPAAENKMIPVRGFAAWAEKGGLAGAIAWFPLDPIYKTIDVLSLKRQEKIALLFQVTGMSDIMRGQGVQPATATEQRIKAGFTSTRVQTQQDELARFATDVQRLRCEIIAKHFDPEEIVRRSNVMRTKDRDLAAQGVQFIKSSEREYRVIVRPESISLPDAAQLKQEGIEFMGAFAQFLSSLQGMPPQVIPYALEGFKWTMSRFKGASQMESVIDRAIDDFKKMLAAPKPPPPPDPKLIAAQVQAKAKQQEMQMKAVQGQQEMQQKAMESRIDLGTKAKIAQMDVQKKQMDIALEAQKAKQQAGLEMMKGQMQMGMQQQQNQMQMQQQKQQNAMEMETEQQRMSNERQRMEIGLKNEIAKSKIPQRPGSQQKGAKKKE